MKNNNQKREEVDSLASSDHEGQEGDSNKEKGAFAGLTKWHIAQMKKDPRYKRVASTNFVVEGNFKDHFQELDDVADASIRIFMDDEFKGVVAVEEAPKGQTEDPKSAVQRKAA